MLIGGRVFMSVIRKAAVAGMFYPDDADVLRKDVQGKELRPRPSLRHMQGISTRARWPQKPMHGLSPLQRE